MFHLLGYITQSSATAGEALRSTQQYLPLLGDAEFRLSVSGDRATISFVYPELMPRVVSDAGMGMAVRLGEVLTGKRLPLVEVRFSYRRPSEAGEYVRFFGTPVRFGCAHDALVCSVDLLETPCSMLTSNSATSCRPKPNAPSRIFPHPQVSSRACTASLPMK
jgi:hypothetical protein